MAGVILVFMASHMAHAEESKQLAEQVQNPVSDLVRVGFTNGTFFGAGFNNHLFNNFEFEASTTRRFGDWALLKYQLAANLFRKARQMLWMDWNTSLILFF